MIQSETREALLTHEYIKKILSYNDSTGMFTWRVDKSQRTKAGDVAGWSSMGYIKISIDHKDYYAHRLAWFYVHGIWPKEQIDHVNHIRNDNRLENLRHTTHSENQRNSSLRKDNKSGVAGVNWCNTWNRWKVRICVAGKRKYVGTFTDVKDAIKARQAANIKYNYHSNHGKA